MFKNTNTSEIEKKKSFSEFLIKNRRKVKNIRIKNDIFNVETHFSLKDNIKAIKYKAKEKDVSDIWSMSEIPNLWENETIDENPKKEKKKEKVTIKEDIYKEFLNFKTTRINKSGRRTPKELWQRIKYLSKGLTIDEWADRVEISWENMLEYTEKIWENYFIYSFKKYSWYPYATKYWSDSWYGQNWRNWRREEDTVTWQINSRTPIHKHIRLSNDATFLFETKKPKTKKLNERFAFPENNDKIIGYNRLKLNASIFTDESKHERLKQGAYNTENFSELNSWHDSANIYLKYIRPWLMRLNFKDKTTYAFKYLGKEYHKKNYKVIPQYNIFKQDLFKINYNLSLIKKFDKEILKSPNFNTKEFERRYGKRNTNLFLKNANKKNLLLLYGKLLHLRHTNINLLKQKRNYNGLNLRNVAKKWLKTNTLNPNL